MTGAVTRFRRSSTTPELKKNTKVLYLMGFLRDATDVELESACFVLAR